MNGSNKLASIPTTIELLIDGQSRIVQVDENGHWETSVDDLSLARHTLVAKSGAVQSSPYSFVVEKPGPISEDWSNLDTDIFLSQGESYTSPHTGLKVTALYVAPGQVGLNLPHISANRLYSGSQQHIECLFPQPVSSISLIVFFIKVHTASEPDQRSFSTMVPRSFRLNRLRFHCPIIRSHTTLLHPAPDSRTEFYQAILSEQQP